MRVAAERSDVERVCDALDRCSHDVAGLLLAVDDRTRPSVGVWDIAETAVHLSQSGPAFLAVARDGAAPEDLGRNADVNQAAVRAEPERRLEVLAERIEAGERELTDYARGVEGDPAVMPFRGVSMPLSAMFAVELGELLVHGFDIARAAGLRWDIDAADAGIALDGALRVLPAMLDASRAQGLRLSCDLRAGRGRRRLITVADGTLSLTPDGVGRDCHVRVEPVAFLLLSFHRLSPVRVLLTGRMVVWGRAPWAFARLQHVLIRV